MCWWAKVAGEAGLLAPFAFVLAALIAGLSGLSYGELGARYPISAGEAVYVYRAFNRRALSVAVGITHRPGRPGVGGDDGARFRRLFK